MSYSFPLSIPTPKAPPIASGGNHSLALKSDGTVVGWGDNTYAQITIPSELSGVVAIASGYYHSLALKSDGTVVGWGGNTYAQIKIPSGLSGVVAIAAGSRHSLALKSDGTVVCWGNNTYGQITIPSGLSGVVAIEGGDYHSLALKSDGTVVGWGYNTYAQITIPSGLSGVVAIASGGYHSLALKSDGTVVCWGDNAYGQITIPSGLSGVVAIASGGNHSLALKSDGTVVCWGNNTYGQITIPSGLSGVVAIEGGGFHSLALKSDGTVVGWGKNTYGQITIPSGLNLKLSQTIASFSPISSKTPGAAPFNITLPTASSGLPVNVTVKSGPATISGNTVTLTGAEGTVVLAANQSGTTDYNAATEVTTSFSVAKLSQTIASFSAISSKTPGAAPFTITPPTASSGLTVTLTVKSGPATISGNTVTLTGAEGTVVLAANQSGTTDYNAATEVTTSFTVAKLSQTIASFSPISSKTPGAAPFNITLPTASSGLPVTVTVKSGPATISGNTVTLTGAEGTVVLAANQSGNSDYYATEVTTSFTVAKLSQTIAAFSPIARIPGAVPFTFTITPPTASSGLPVTVTVKSGPATISGGNTVTLTGDEGTVVLAANQSGNANYSAATEVMTSFTVAKLQQAIERGTAFSQISSKLLGEAPFTITPPTATSGLPVTVTVKSGPATISGGATGFYTVTLTGDEGIVVLAANQSGNANYYAAQELTTSFSVTRTPQQISAWLPIPSQTYTSGATLSITLPTASSGLPVAVTVKSGPATILGNTVTLTGPGVVTLASNQSGDTTYAPAAEQTVSFQVGLSSQTISAFAPISPKTQGDVFTVTAPTASSGLPVAVTVKSGPALISANTVTIIGTGTVVLAANQSGNNLYNPAAEVTTSFAVTKASQVIAPFTFIPDQAFRSGLSIGPIQPPSASSGLPVTVTIKSGPATLSGTIVRPTGSGTITLAANQLGNANYLKAAEVTISFRVLGPQSWITELSIEPQRRTTRSFTVDYPTTTNGGPVSLEVISGPAIISGNTITLTGQTGTVTIRANQAGDQNTSGISSTYSFAVADEIVTLYKRVNSLTEPYNDVEITGDNYIYGRLVSGTVPDAINWVGTSKGIKFWGTPLTADDFTATFEGPYPANFRSSRTTGGWPSEPTSCDATQPPQDSIQVSSFVVAFIVTELPQESFNLGEVLYWLAQPWDNTRLYNLAARRWSWRSSGKYIRACSAISGSASSDKAQINQSATKPLMPLYLDNAGSVVKSSMVGKSEMMAADWSFGVITNGLFEDITTAWRHDISDRLITETAREQYVIPETAEYYASFNGIKIDRSYPIAFNCSIPFGSNEFAWGEFFLPDGGADLKILFYTRQNGKITTSPYCQLGIKSMMRVFADGYQDYRRAGIRTYDFISSSTQVITSEQVSVEGKHIIVNIQPISGATIPPSLTAHVLITL